MSKEQRIRAISYNHDKKQVVIKLNKKMSSFGIGGKELILLLWQFFVEENASSDNIRCNHDWKWSGLTGSGRLPIAHCKTCGATKF